LSRPTTNGVIAGSPHAPYPDLAANVRPGGMLNELARTTGERIVFYYAFGERSATSVQAAQDAGLASARRIQGGIDAWKKAGRFCTSPPSRGMPPQTARCRETSRSASSARLTAGLDYMLVLT
jgi:hypothetical protein